MNILCACEESQAVTNADRFRAMSDEELAAALSRISILDLCDIVCGGYCKAVATFNKTSQQRCEEIVLNWLQQPVIGLRAGQPAACFEKSIAELKGDKDEYYLDAYKKFENKRIKA